jgi:protein-tyrosine phosphatase
MLDQISLDQQIVEPSLPARQRRLAFAGAKNFRDLGGYPSTDGRTTRWGILYRSDNLHRLKGIDHSRLVSLNLDRIIDFRAEHETAQEPDRLPARVRIQLVGIPILDSSTELWRKPREQLMKGDLRSIDPVHYMTQTYQELGTRFAPQMQVFMNELFRSNGRPVLFHCAAGKDRTGFAAAALLRILGVPQQVVMEDYLLTNQYYFSAHKWNLAFVKLIKGRRVSTMIAGFLEARPAYLSAAFAAVDDTYGSFENYIHDGLGLTPDDIGRLKSMYLE